MKRVALIFGLLVYAIDSLPQVMLQNGLIGCYNFAGNPDDGSGYHNDGTVNSAVLTQDRFGNAGQAYLFNPGASIKIPSAQIVASKNYSWSLWAYITQPPAVGEGQAIFSVGPTGSNEHVALSLTNAYSTAVFTGWTTGGYVQGDTVTSVTTKTFPNSRQWYHLVCTRDDSALKLYVNSQLIGTAAPGSPWFYQKTSCLALIGLRSNGDQGFGGAIDEVGVWNRVLNQDEVTKLYTDGLPCSPPPPPPPIVAGISFCGAASASLTATGGTAFRWYDAETGGSVVFNGNPFITPVLTITTSYFVAAVSGNQESTRVKVTVTIFPQPLLECLIPATGNVDESLDFSANVTGGTPPFKYTFDFGDQTGTSTSVPETSHTYLSDGDLDVKIAVTDKNGCVANCAQTITVEFEYFVPNVITQNADTLNRQFTLFVVVRRKHYPYRGAKPFYMEVHNRWGKEVYHTRDATAGWKGEDNSFGTYYYSISLGELKFKGWVELLR